MGVNIFFCNGPMSALSSCLISDYLFEENPENEFILCVEQGSHVLSAYYKIVDLLVAQNERFKKVIRMQVEFRTMSLHNPANFFQNVSYYKSISREVRKQLDLRSLGDGYEIWAPTTSRLWQFFKNKKNRLHVIEHGLGEYISAPQTKEKTWRNRVSEFLGDLIGYPSLSRHHDAWFCSYAVMLQPSERVVQINFAKEYAEYVQKFWRVYQMSCHDACQELKSIATLIDNHLGAVYLYLPGDEIRDDRQEEFIRNQMKHLNIPTDALLIVKNHPIDIKSQHWRHLNGFGKCINIENKFNCYMPVEFIVKILGVQNVIGSSSSALFYLKSWDPKVNVMIYNDYNSDMLTDESKNLKFLLASVGLVDKVASISAGSGECNSQKRRIF